MSYRAEIYYVYLVYNNFYVSVLKFNDFLDEYIGKKVYRDYSMHTCISKFDKLYTLFKDIIATFNQIESISNPFMDYLFIEFKNSICNSAFIIINQLYASISKLDEFSRLIDKNFLQQTKHNGIKSVVLNILLPKTSYIQKSLKELLSGLINQYEKDC